MKKIHISETTVILCISGGYVQCTVRNWNLCFRERGFRTEDSCLLSARNICYWHSRSLTKNGKTNLILHSHFRKRFMELCVAWFTINVTVFRGWIKKTNSEWRILWNAILLTIYKYKCRLLFWKNAKNFRNSLFKKISNHFLKILKYMWKMSFEYDIFDN